MSDEIQQRITQLWNTEELLDPAVAEVVAAMLHHLAVQEMRQRMADLLNSSVPINAVWHGTKFSGAGVSRKAAALAFDEAKLVDEWKDGRDRADALAYAMKAANKR
jgi:chaperonin GroEL (HSP60 family)